MKKSPSVTSVENATRTNRNYKSYYAQLGAMQNTVRKNKK